jgi:hypothetical protein
MKSEPRKPQTVSKVFFVGDRFMKRIWQNVFVLFLALVFFGNWAFAQEAKRPKIVIEGMKHDFKDVNQGEVVAHSFRVFNKGSATLKIIKVKPG